MNSPDFASCCVYCGEPEPASASASCCEERHFHTTAVCPVCATPTDLEQHSITGIQTYIHRCSACDWQSDPE